MSQLRMMPASRRPRPMSIRSAFTNKIECRRHESRTKSLRVPKSHTVRVVKRFSHDAESAEARCVEALRVQLAERFMFMRCFWPAEDITA